MSVTAPPRPPRPSDPVTHGEFDALVEALIEEARQRTRRRRRRNGAVVTLVALVGVALFALLGRSAQSQTASPAISARSSLAAQAATSKIAFISEPARGGYCGVVYVMNADGSGQRMLANTLMRHVSSSLVARRAECQRQHQLVPRPAEVALVSNGIYVMNADGSGQRKLTAHRWLRRLTGLVARRAEDRLRTATRGSTS